VASREASRQSPGASRQPLVFIGRRRGWRHRVVLRAVLSFNRGTDLRHAGPGLVHLHRVTRDVEADASRHAMRLPRRPSVDAAAFDETVIVVAVPHVLTAAEARDIVKDLRVSRCERVHSLNDLGRPRCRIRTRRKRRQLASICRRRWCERNGRLDGHFGCLGGRNRGGLGHRLRIPGRSLLGSASHSHKRRTAQSGGYARCTN